MKCMETQKEICNLILGLKGLIILFFENVVSLLVSIRVNCFSDISTVEMYFDRAAVSTKKPASRLQ